MDLMTRDALLFFGVMLLVAFLGVFISDRLAARIWGS